MSEQFKPVKIGEVSAEGKFTPVTRDDLDTLRPEVRCATAELEDTFLEYRICVGKYPFSDEWQTVLAELLRLADENKRMRGIIETLDVEGHRRAEKAEAELATLKARIADAPVATLVLASSAGDLMLIWAENPDEWVDKDVRLLVDEPPAERGEG